MKEQDYFDLANAQAKADFISRELSKYYEKQGTCLAVKAAKAYLPVGVRFETAMSEFKRIRTAAECLSDLYDDIISPVFEAHNE